MTMSDEERQRLRQVEAAAEELANTLDFQQQAIEAVQLEIKNDMDKRFRRIGNLFDTLIGDIREDRKAIRAIEQRLENED